jgi:hypothetical protein
MWDPERSIGLLIFIHVFAGIFITGIFLWFEKMNYTARTKSFVGAACGMAFLLNLVFAIAGPMMINFRRDALCASGKPAVSLIAKVEYNEFSGKYSFQKINNTEMTVIGDYREVRNIRVHYDAPVGQPSWISQKPVACGIMDVDIHLHYSDELGRRM